MLQNLNMGDLRKKLGKRIQELRNLRSITQAHLAEQIGIDTTSLSKIETGRNYPSSDNLEKIAAVLKTTPCELYNFNGDETTQELIDEITKDINFIKNDKLKLKIIKKTVKSIIYTK